MTIYWWYARASAAWAKEWAANVLFGFIDCDGVLDGDGDDGEHNEANAAKRTRAVAKLIKRIDPMFQHPLLSRVLSDDGGTNHE